jgi:hypothetical protein
VTNETTFKSEMELNQIEKFFKTVSGLKLFFSNLIVLKELDITVHPYQETNIFSFTVHWFLEIRFYDNLPFKSPFSNKLFSNLFFSLG